MDAWKDRPGPAFYINKMNNDKLHEGLPCFGKVVLGMHVVDQLGQREGPMDSPFFLQPPISIIKAQILDKLEDAVGGETRESTEE